MLSIRRSVARHQTAEATGLELSSDVSNDGPIDLETLFTKAAARGVSMFDVSF